MSTTGTSQASPLKTGAPVIDYASGLSGAFAVASALFQRERTGRGQHIDCSMPDAALTMMSSGHRAPASEAAGAWRTA